MAKRATGRPTKYKKSMDEMAYKLALLGLTDEETAKSLGICVATLNLWKKAHPSFLESLKDGKVPADAEVVASLRQRALGYSHKEDKIFNNNGVPMVVETTKHYPPDTAAAIYWLNNRNPSRWRNRKELEVVDKTNKVINGTPVSEDDWIEKNAEGDADD